MFKLFAQYEKVINGKNYRLQCDNDAPVDDFQDFVFDLLVYAKQVKEQAKILEAQKQAEPKVEALEA